MTQPDDSPAKRSAFQTTHWSLVLAAASKDSVDSERALAELCERYWYPLFAFIRKRGYSFPDAQDMTQAFFATVIDKDYLKDLTREGGKFRSFLLTALTWFLAKEVRGRTTQKRGGAIRHLSLDFEHAESQYRNEPAHELSPETLFERQWALTLIDRSLAGLEAEYTQAGNGELYQRLKVCLTPKEQSYRVVAEELGMREGAFKTAIHRFRQRLGQRIRQEIAETVETSEQVEEELRALFQSLRGVL